MRRFLFGIALASMTALGPAVVHGDDSQIADTIISQLQEHQNAGRLKGFDIDLRVDGGKVTVSGTVANVAQLETVMAAAQSAPGVSGVDNQLVISSATGDESFSLDKAVRGGPSRPESIVPSGALAPLPAAVDSTARDVAINNAVMHVLAAEKQAGRLRRFELDVTTVEEEVTLRGFVADSAQLQLVLEKVRRVPGVKRVVNDLEIGSSSVQTASDAQPVPPAGMAQQPQRAMPRPMNAGQPTAAPQHGVPGHLVSHPVPVNTAGMVPGQTPVSIAPTNYGAGVPRYDQPNMPAYAWPSYAAHPNYAAVTYPQQYSASAWPYIGPFYPYPQVPLGWRKVTLQWDDGLWFLDFKSR